MARKMNTKRIESFLKKLSYSNKILRSVFEDDHCSSEHFEVAFQLVLSTLGRISYYSPSSIPSIIGIARSILLPMITHPQFTSSHLISFCSKKELDSSNWYDLTFFFQKEFLKEDSEARQLYNKSTCRMGKSSRVQNNYDDINFGRRSNSYIRPEALRTKFFDDFNQTLEFLNENGGSNYALALLSDLPGLRDLATRSLKKKEAQ